MGVVILQKCFPGYAYQLYTNKQIEKCTIMAQNIFAKLKGKCNIAAQFARVAELVDAADSKSAIRKDVLVRFQSRALNK